MLGLERINPKLDCDSQGEIDREKRRVQQMKADLDANGEDDFRSRHGHFEGTPQEYVARCEESLIESMMKRELRITQAKRARALLDSVGGAAEWKDHKLAWETSEDWE